jgi:hypothetical protein
MKKILLLLCLCLSSYFAITQEWRLQLGAASNIAVGANGAVWSIGLTPTDGSYNIQSLNGNSWQSIDGGGVHIAVDPNGLPWVINEAGQIWQRTTNGWVAVAGLAKDIAIGANGAVWSIGNTPTDGGFNIQSWNGKIWQNIDGGGVRIAVDPKGNPWVINSANQIFRRVDNSWVLIVGSATDIAIGANGDVWIIGTSAREGGFNISKWNDGNWVDVDGGGKKIAVENSGIPIVTNHLNQIFRRFNANAGIAQPIEKTPILTQPTEKTAIPRPDPPEGGGNSTGTPFNPSTTYNDIQIFPRPNYDGTPGNFTNTPLTGGFRAPFPVTNSSFRVPSGRIVYLRYCDLEFPYERAYTEDQININLTNVCGIRSDDHTSFSLHFDGISTTIHNDDCRTVFGKVEIKVVELSPGGDMAYMPLVVPQTIYRPNPITFMPMNMRNAGSLRALSNFVFNDSPVPDLSGNIVRGLNNQVGIWSSFQVGQTALREGRVKIIVMSNIAGAHKTCHTCAGYSSNVHMERQVTEEISINVPDASRNINASRNSVVLGPYRAVGNRDGFSFEASGTAWEIEKNYRVHLHVQGLR